MGGKPWTIQKERQSPAYYVWRDAVLERDGRICRACGKADKTVVAHHLEAYATNPDLRLDVSNGVALCKACHWDFHLQYGRGRNTRWQFTEYLKNKLREMEAKNNDQ